MTGMDTTQIIIAVCALLGLTYPAYLLYKKSTKAEVKAESNEEETLKQAASKQIYTTYKDIIDHYVREVDGLNEKYNRLDSRCQEDAARLEAKINALEEQIKGMRGIGLSQ